MTQVARQCQKVNLAWCLKIEVKVEQVTTFAIPKVQDLTAGTHARITSFSGLKVQVLDPDQVTRNARACECVPGDGNVSTFMPELLDDLVSVHGQGSVEAQTNASARAANDGLDLFHDCNLG